LNTTPTPPSQTVRPSPGAIINRSGLVSKLMPPSGR
jgi:hypothetical protein